mgnify:CR=1 FL=1
MFFRAWSVLGLAAVAALSFGPLDAVAREVAVNIEKCPATLTLQVPSEFTAANDEWTRGLRSAVLDGLHANPGRKARYAELLLANWHSRKTLPSIAVGSLGSTFSHQGRFTRKNWEELRRDGLASSQSQMESWMKQGMARLKPGLPSNIEKMEGRVLSLRSGDPDELALFGESTGTVDGAAMRWYTVAKLAYAQMCIAYVLISVDASEPRALERLVEIAEQVRVK